MDAVLAFLDDIDADPTKSSPEKRDKLRKLVHQAIKVDNLSSEPVPVSVARHAVMNIIYPEYDIGRTKPLLELITSLELARKSHLEAINAYYPDLLDEEPKPNGPSSKLPGDVIQELIRQKDMDVIMREMFIKVIDACCSNHVYQIWMAGDNMTAFWAQFNYYFPKLLDKALPTCTFYHHMSPNETQLINTETMKACLSAIVSTFEAASHNGDYIPDFVGSLDMLPQIIQVYIDTIFEDAKIIERAFSISEESIP